MKWAPALAAACLHDHRPGGVPAHAPLARSASIRATRKLFSDVYSMEQSTEPQAATPIHELFEDNQ